MAAWGAVSAFFGILRKGLVCVLIEFEMTWLALDGNSLCFVGSLTLDLA